MESACIYPVGQILEERGFPQSLVAEVMQDLYLQLQANSGAELRSFRGTTEPQLRSYLRRMARRFANRWAAKERRRRKREAKAVLAYLTAVRDGPTEQQIGSRYRELQATMPQADREKLQCVSPYAAWLSGQADPSAAAAPAVPERTRQRWRLELVRKYAG